MKRITWIVWHQLCDLLVVIGMRDRLRCPECKAVGTWNPHGGWLDDSKASGRRWVCKWCGHYVGIPFNEGDIIKRKAFIDPELKCWRLADFYTGKKLPEGAFIPKDVVKANPWKG